MRIASVLAIAAIVAGACSSSGGTTAPTGLVPADQLIKAGTLTVCSDTAYPPQEYLDKDQKPIGADIDLINAIGQKLGLTVVVKSTDFNAIIPALTSGNCDIIISAQTITADRQKQVDMIPYFQAGQSFVVLKGNPDNIRTVDDLCGKSVAAEDGTVEAMHVSGTGDYKPEDGLSQQCVAKGKAAITLKTFTADTDALLALQAGTVSAHFTDEPVAGYEVVNGGGKFEMVPDLNLERGPEGISVGKNHTVLRDAIKTTLNAMIADGSYMTILTKWGIQSGAVTTANS